jgi:transcription initiation factor TFIIH subunit 4
MSTKKSSASNNVVHLECKNLHEYIKSQPPQVIMKLFEFPAICLAVFRDCIPEIAKQFVMRMLCVEQPVPQAVVSSWASQIYAK